MVDGTPPRQAGLVDQRRDQIIAVAGTLFGARGSIEVSMDEIASAAGVARSTVYVYFSSRQELIAACIGNMDLQMRTQVAAIDRSSPEVALTQLFEALLVTIDSQPVFFRLVLAANGSTGGVGQAVTEQLTSIAETVSTEIEALLDGGCQLGLWHIDDLERTSRFVGQLIYGSLAVRSLGIEVTNPSEEAHAMVNLLVNGLRGPAARPESPRASRVSHR